MQIRFLRTPGVRASTVFPSPVAKLRRDSSSGHKLPRPVPWDCSLVVTTMVSYYGGLHFPLSYSGLSLVASVLHEPPTAEFKALSLLVLQSAELCGTVWLIESSVKDATVISFHEQVWKNRRCWLLVSAGAVVAASLFALLHSSSAVGVCNSDDDALKQLMVCGGATGLCATIAVYCLVTPLLEEFVYRGFVLPSLAEYMAVQKAICLSSVLFSLSHLNNLSNPAASVALFFVGLVLACTYTCTGDLAAPLALHSLYNTIVLLLALFSNSA